MKKSLSTILSLAMAFSMFSSVALAAEADATKTTADFTDLKDLDAATKAKFDALISAGVFDGVKEGTFGLKDEMNRAQFAKVAALIFGLKVDTTLKTSTFTDVKSDDPANGYALPYIEAVKAAGITDGFGPGVYNPAGKVTKQELATFLVRGLGKDAAGKATPGVNDATVSDWAKGYVALALQLKLVSNGTDGKFGGTSNATRDLLVLGASEAKAQYKGPAFNGKYAINSFKATDADKLAIVLNGALSDADAKNLKIEIKNGNGSVVTNYTTKWSDDKQTATLTFDSKFQDGSFVATISGLTNIDETAKTSTVAVTKERIAKIEFLTASDTLPKSSKKLRIDFKATNQYGAKSSLTYNNFSINVGSNVSYSGVSGEQAFYIQMPEKAGYAGESALDRNERISVTIIHEDSGTTANKVFAVGDLPNVSKIEVGDLKNSSNTKLDAIEAQKETYLDFKAFDQYGIPVQDQVDLIKGITVFSSDGNIVRVTEKDGRQEWFTGNEIGDDAADLKFKYDKKEAKDNVIITLIANGSGQQVTKTVKVTAPKTPATIEFGTYSYILADGDIVTNDSDTDKKMYVPLTVKDAKGDTLTPQEIADNADKFTIYSTGSVRLASYAGSKGSTPIVQSGENKGKIGIQEVGAKGTSGITVQLLDTPTVKATWSTSVGDKRVADKIAFTTSPKKYMINNTDNEFKMKVYDQHGGEMKLNNDDFRVQLQLKANTNITTVGSATYNAATYNPTTGVRYYGLAVKSNFVKDEVAGGDAGNAKKYSLTPNSQNTTATVSNIPLNDIWDKNYRFFTNDKNGDYGNGGAADIATANAGKVNLDSAFPKRDRVVPDTSYTLTASLIKRKNSSVDFASTFATINSTTATAVEKANASSNLSTVNEITTTLEVLNSNDDKNKLTYEVYLDKQVNNSILATDEFLGGLGTTSAASATYLYGVKTVVNGVDLWKNRKLATEVKVRAKNSSGQDVAIPSNVTAISSSNPTIVSAANNPDGTFSKNIFGLKVGTAKLAVQFTDAKGETKVGNIDVTAKNEAPAVQSIVLKKTGATVSRASLPGLYVWDALLAEKITVKDQYGHEFVSDRVPGAKKDDGGGPSDQFLLASSEYLNLTYYASDIVTSDKAAGTVSFNSTTPSILSAVSANVTSFTLNVLSPSGVTASISVTVAP